MKRRLVKYRGIAYRGIDGQYTLTTWHIYWLLTYFSAIKSQKCSRTCCIVMPLPNTRKLPFVTMRIMTRRARAFDTSFS